MRIYVSGPHIGPVRTVVWSSGHRRHVRGAGWLYLLIAACGGITWAYIAALWIGVLVSVILALVIALAVYGIVAARREMRQRAAAKDGSPGWKAEHVPASAEYRAAHPEGPRDWEPAN